MDKKNMDKQLFATKSEKSRKVWRTFVEDTEHILERQCRNNVHAPGAKACPTRVPEQPREFGLVILFYFFKNKKMVSTKARAHSLLHAQQTVSFATTKKETLSHCNIKK
jgi:aromatic ring-opening dioxygenase LigB subunit